MAKIEAKDIVFLRNKTSAGMGICKEALEAVDGDMEKAIDYINEKSDVFARLYNQTGASIGKCKIAFADADKDFEKAIEIIKERGWEKDNLDADAGADAKGAIGSYVHGTDRRTVAMVEVECKTDFVSSNEKFIELCNELATQAAAMKPEYVSEKAIPEDELKEMKELFARETKEEGKPDNIVEKIVEGKLNKYYAEKCLLNQKWFKDDKKTMQNVLDEYVQTLGENMTVRRVLVWEFGKEN